MLVRHCGAQMKKVNLEREVLQSEVQRVVGLEKQREEELTHAVVRCGLCGLLREPPSWG